MQRRIANVSCGVLLLSACSVARAHAQPSGTPPRVYSYNAVGAPLWPDQQLTIARDGDWEFVERSFPVSAARPQGYRDRTLVDYKAQKSYFWLPDEPNRPCAVQPFDLEQTAVASDVIAGYREVYSALASQKVKTVGKEVVNGLGSRVIEFSDAAGTFTLRLWVAEQGGFLVKMVMTPKGKPPQTTLEVKNIRYDKPPASELALPPQCVRADRDAATPAKGPALAKITLAKVQLSPPQYSGSCTPGRLQVTATVTADGAGTAWYRFKFVGFTFAQGEEGTISFARAGTQSVTREATFTYDPGTRVGNAGGYLTVAMQESASTRGPETTSDGVNYNVNCTTGDGSASLSLPIRINAGGPAQTDTKGIRWEADQGYSGGQLYQDTNAPVKAPTTGGVAPNLFQTERWDDKNFSYAFDVPNGMYNVRLRFAEVYFRNVGERVLGVDVNGNHALSRFDIVAAAKGPFIPIDMSVPVKVTTGKIVIQFIKIVQNPKVNAIEIVPVP